ncbi:MAG: hypothetical protein ABI114_18130 [Rhodanobacter sp.]
MIAFLTMIAFLPSLSEQNRSASRQLSAQLPQLAGKCTLSKLLERATKQMSRCFQTSLGRISRVLKNTPVMRARMARRQSGAASACFGLAEYGHVPDSARRKRQESRFSTTCWCTESSPLGRLLLAWCGLVGLLATPFPAPPGCP